MSKKTLYHSSSISPNSYPFHLHLLSTIISLAGFLILRNKFDHASRNCGGTQQRPETVEKRGQLVEDS
jgi:hypothetical protein